MAKESASSPFSDLRISFPAVCSVGAAQADPATGRSVAKVVSCATTAGYRICIHSLGQRMFDRCKKSMKLTGKALLSQLKNSSELRTWMQFQSLFLHSPVTKSVLFTTSRALPTKLGASIV